MKKEFSMEKLLKKEKAYTLARNISIVTASVGVFSFMATPLFMGVINLPAKAWMGIISTEYLGLGFGGLTASCFCHMKKKHIQNIIHERCNDDKQVLSAEEEQQRKASLEGIHSITRAIYGVKDEDENENN